jgi:hypothetical protein
MAGGHELNNATTLILAVIALIGIVAGVLFGIYRLAASRIGQEGRSLTETRAGAAGGDKCAERFRITRPQDLKKISGDDGVKLRGRACETDHIWVLDLDPYDGLLYLDNARPLDIGNGVWTFRNRPIGNEMNDDIGTIYTLVAVRVSEIAPGGLLSLLRLRNRLMTFPCFASFPKDVLTSTAAATFAKCGSKRLALSRS